MNNKVNVKLGGGTSLLGIVFVTLRLCGVIDWSWWWVTAPFWGPWAIIIGLLGIAFMAALVHEITK